MAVEVYYMLLSLPCISQPPSPRATKTIRMGQVSQHHHADNTSSGHKPSSRPADAGARLKIHRSSAALHVLPTKAPSPFLIPNRDQAHKEALVSYILTCEWRSYHTSLRTLTFLDAARAVAGYVCF